MGNLAPECRHPTSCQPGTCPLTHSQDGQCLNAGSLNGVEQFPHPDLINKDLVRAAHEGDHFRVKVALLSGADVHSTVTIPRGVRKTGTQPEEGYSLLCQPEEQLTALMQAAKGGHLKCVAALLEALASVNSADEKGRGALHFAACSGNYEVGSALVCAGAVRSKADTGGLLALNYIPRTINAFEVGRWEALLTQQPKPTLSESPGRSQSRTSDKRSSSRSTSRKR